MLSKKFSNINRSKFEIHKQIAKECKAFDDAQDISDIEFLSFLGTQKFENSSEKNVFDVLFKSNLDAINKLKDTDSDLANSADSKETLLTKATQIKEGTQLLSILLSNPNIDVNKVDSSEIPSKSTLT